MLLALVLALWLSSSIGVTEAALLEPAPQSDGAAAVGDTEEVVIAGFHYFQFSADNPQAEPAYYVYQDRNANGRYDAGDYHFFNSLNAARAPGWTSRPRSRQRPVEHAQDATHAAPPETRFVWGQVLAVHDISIFDQERSQILLSNRASGTWLIDLGPRSPATGHTWRVGDAMAAWGALAQTGDAQGVLMAEQTWSGNAARPIFLVTRTRPFILE